MAEASGGGSLPPNVAEHLKDCDIDSYTDDVLDVVRGLGDEELAVLSRVRLALDAAGASDHVKSQIV